MLFVIWTKEMILHQIAHALDDGNLDRAMDVLVQAKEEHRELNMQPGSHRRIALSEIGMDMRYVNLLEDRAGIIFVDEFLAADPKELAKQKDLGEKSIKKVAAQVLAFRYRQYKAEHEICFVCEKEWMVDEEYGQFGLEIHHLCTGGAAHRVRHDPRGWLLCCKRHHEELQKKDAGSWPLSKQCALKKYRDPDNYDLEWVNAVSLGRMRVDPLEVARWFASLNS